MKKEHSGNLENLETVRNELESWRAQRKGKERIPEKLWRAAIAQLKHHSLYKVSRTLKLDYQQLKNRCEMVDVVVKQNRKRAFVEISARALGRAANSEAQCQLIFERADGSKLTLHLAEKSLIKLICESFWRG